MIDLLHALVERYGLLAVFAGCLAEGESAAIFGGFFAHQRVFEVWATVAVAFTGAFLGDTALFLAGRRFADHPHGLALRSRPGFNPAHGMVERHPNIFILSNRFIWGLRMVGGVAAGLSSVPVPRFLALNAASALAWEWLRRNEGYNQDFEALSAQEADTTKLTETIRQRWRLRFRGRPRDRSRYPAGVLVGAGRYQCRRPCRCAR